MERAHVDLARLVRVEAVELLVRVRARVRARVRVRVSSAVSTRSNSSLPLPLPLSLSLSLSLSLTFLIVSSLQRCRSGDFDLGERDREPSFALPPPFASRYALGSLAPAFQSARGGERGERPSLPPPLRSPRSCARSSSFSARSARISSAICGVSGTWLG